MLFHTIYIHKKHFRKENKEKNLFIQNFSKITKVNITFQNFKQSIVDFIKPNQFCSFDCISLKGRKYWVNISIFHQCICIWSKKQYFGRKGLIFFRTGLKEFDKKLYKCWKTFFWKSQLERLVYSGSQCHLALLCCIFSNFRDSIISRT